MLRLVGIAWFAVALLAGHAHAQSGTMSTGLYSSESSFRPDLSAGDLKVIERVLGLDTTEKQALDELYAGYAATLKNEGGEVRDFVNGEIERAQALQNANLLDKARQRIMEWERHSEKVKKAFLDDLKSLLSKDQEARWPIVERELRRIRLIGNGRLSGESVDLVRLTEDALGAVPEAELAELLNRYSGELDHALQSREEFLNAKRSTFHELITSNPAAAKELWEEAQRVRGSVRDVNDRYARMIAEQISAAKRSSFQKQVFNKTYPVLVRPTIAETYLKDAGELGTLTAQQKSMITGIKNRYETELSALKAKGGAAWRQYESEDKPEQLAVALGERVKDENHQLYTGAWLPETHPLVRYRLDRLTLDRDLRNSLDAALTPEQRGNVPSRTTPNAMFENWEPYGL